MIHLQNVKFFQIIKPDALVDAGSFTTVVVDTLGYDYATIVYNVGTTDIAMSALKVQECATSGGSYTDISGLDMDGDTDTDGATAVLPVDDDDGDLVAFEIDLRTRERFLNVIATNGNGTNGGHAACIAILSRAHDVPVTATERGVSNVLRV